MDSNSLERYLGLGPMSEERLRALIDPVLRPSVVVHPQPKPVPKPEPAASEKRIDEMTLLDYQRCCAAYFGRQGPVEW